MVGAADELTSDSILEHVSSLAGALTLGPTSAELAYGERKFVLPLGAADALTYIAHNKRFKVCELPGLSSSSQLVICSRLLRAHILRLTSNH